VVNHFVQTDLEIASDRESLRRISFIQSSTSLPGSGIELCPLTIFSFDVAAELGQNLI